MLATVPYCLTVLNMQLSAKYPKTSFLKKREQGRVRLTLYSRNGIGMNAIDRNPNVELAQPTPKFLYMAVANSGNPAPKLLLMKSFPASTLAAYSGYASGR